jgi:hypothetical protein
MYRKELKLLHGETRPSRVNYKESAPGMVPIEPPYKLRPKVRAVWDRLAPDRIRRGVLSAWATDAFALFCEGLVIPQRGAAEADGPIVPGAPSPMSRFKDAVAICSSLGGRFRWTQSDRQTCRW